MTPSKALEINLQTSRCEVVLDPKYKVLQEIMAGYAGLLPSLNALLEEACHPYKNWSYILQQARGIALNNFHLLLKHPQGAEGAGLFLDLFLEGLTQTDKEEARAEAAENLLLFLQEVVNQTKAAGGFGALCRQGFARMAELDDSHFGLVVRGFHQVKVLVASFAEAVGQGGDLEAAFHLLKRYLAHTYEYWLTEPDPWQWFTNQSETRLDSPHLRAIFEPICHQTLREHGEQLRRASYHPDQAGQELASLLELPGYKDITTLYERLPLKLARAGEGAGLGDQWKLLFLFHILNLTGLAHHHERVLGEMNRTLARLITHEEPELVRTLVGKAFAILERMSGKYPLTALSCVLNMGKAVLQLDKNELMEFFLERVLRLGFQTPDIKGVGQDWQVRSNLAHVRNIRTWLELVEVDPLRTRKLLSGLIIHLALGGVFIKDTDLFARDISALLNRPVRPVYNLVKQLCRLLPVYFNEIGAEGALRDISTELDEACQRRDRLVHFLRKQSHVESSPQTVTLMEAAFEFWRLGGKEPLAELVPPDIYAAIEEKGPLVDGMRRLLREVFERGGLKRPEDLLALSEEQMSALVEAGQNQASELDRRRLKLAHTFYQMLHQKYHTGLAGLTRFLGQIPGEHFPEFSNLKKALGRKHPLKKLVGVLDYMEQLNQLILSPELFPAQEEIYYKRHIAADIPSMYGSYHEPKFDAMGLGLRLESVVNILFQELVDTIDLKLITRTTVVRIHEYLRIFERALALDGMPSQEFSLQLDLLTQSLHVRGFSFTQYLDIFRGLSRAVSNLVNDYFDNIHHDQIDRILASLPAGQLLAKYLRPGEDLANRETRHRISEIFLRDRIATSLGLQQLDKFVAAIVSTIFQQGRQLPRDQLRHLLNYDPGRAFTPLSPVNPEVEDIIYLGNKGFNLVQATALGMPVPPGFIVTTEVYRCREVIRSYEPAAQQFRGMLGAQVDRLASVTGRAYGDPDNPLLFSVRSGSSISQPGMLSTFLNVGLTLPVVEGMAAQPGKEWFAWDCYRRFLQSFGMAHGLSRDAFDAIMAEHKKKYGLPYKREFYGSQMREVALAYQAFLTSRDIEVEEDPYAQLYLAINSVLDSWQSDKAHTYRQIMSISDDWGTACTVQAMVFGNLSARSGSGVFFTHNPRWSEDKIMLWGDYTLNNQGEDVVSGLVETKPLSLKQARAEQRPAEASLETNYPAIYAYMGELAEKLVYDWGYGPQEVEFTFEGPKREDLYILQIRDMALRERIRGDGLDLSRLPPDSLLGHGIGVSGGAISGRLVFSLEEIQRWRQEEPDTPLILVRGDTVPDDIKEIFESDGLLTARGGSTSHAAIVAHRLSKVCVVGVGQLICDEPGQACQVGGAALKSGQWITMNGQDGMIYQGRMTDPAETEKGMAPR